MANELLTKTSSKQARSLRSEERLLDALEGLLDDGVPFDRISVEDIAARADYTKGAFYNRYANKTSILIQLTIERFAPRMLESIANALSETRCKDMSISEIVYTYLSTTMEFLRRYRAISIAMNRHVDEENATAALLKARQEFNNRTLGYLLARLFDHSANIGHSDPSAAVRFADRSAYLTIREVVYYGGTDKDHFTLDQEDKDFLRELTRQYVAYIELGDPVAVPESVEA